MKKVEIEYRDGYGDIPKTDMERFAYLLKNARISKKKTVTDKIRRILNIKWETLHFTIWLVPKATPRPRHNTLRNIFYVMGAKDNKEIFKKAFINEDLPIIYTPCKFKCISYFPIPKSMRDDEKVLAELGFVRPISKPDFDNIAKTYSDMLQGLLIYDDAYIVEGVSKKFYSVKPRIEITVEYMTEYDSIFNEKKIRKKVFNNE